MSLFHEIKFFLSQKVPSRFHFIQEIHKNGGIIVKLEKQADIVLVDDARKEKLPGTYSYKFVEQSLRSGKLLDLEDFVVGPKVATTRTIGSAAQPARTTRVKFTPADDVILTKWVNNHPQSNGGANGNKIYQELEQKYPHHPWQSWRDRWIKYTSNNLPPIAPSPDPSPPTPPTTDDQGYVHSTRGEERQTSYRSARPTASPASRRITSPAERSRAAQSTAYSFDQSRHTSLSSSDRTTSVHRAALSSGKVASGPSKGSPISRTSKFASVDFTGNSPTFGPSKRYRGEGASESPASQPSRFSSPRVPSRSPMRHRPVVGSPALSLASRASQASVVSRGTSPGAPGTPTSRAARADTVDRGTQTPTSGSPRRPMRSPSPTRPMSGSKIRKNLGPFATSSDEEYADSPIGKSFLGRKRKPSASPNTPNKRQMKEIASTPDAVVKEEPNSDVSSGSSLFVRQTDGAGESRSAKSKRVKHKPLTQSREDNEDPYEKIGRLMSETLSDPEREPLIEKPKLRGGRAVDPAIAEELINFDQKRARSAEARAAEDIDVDEDGDVDMDKDFELPAGMNFDVPEPQGGWARLERDSSPAEPSTPTPRRTRDMSLHRNQEQYYTPSKGKSPVTAQDNDANTQGILDGATQAVPFAIPSPEGGWAALGIPSSPIGEEEEAVTAPTTPAKPNIHSTRPATHRTIAPHPYPPSSPEHSTSFALPAGPSTTEKPSGSTPLPADPTDTDAALNTWITTQSATFSASITLIEEVLQRCTLDTALTLRVLEHMRDDGPMTIAAIPDNWPGVWSKGDDEALFGSDAREIQRMMGKHTNEGVDARFAFLEVLSWNDEE